MLFDLIYALVLIVISPYYIIKSFFHKKYRAGLSEKFGFLSRKKSPQKDRTIWFHCVSVGETLAAAELIDVLRKEHSEYSIALSTTTNTGREVAEKKNLADVYFYYPFDFTFAVKRVLSVINPDCIVLTELEVWPNLVKIAGKRNIPVGVINGRLSETSYKGFMRFRFMAKKIFSRLTFCSVQDEEYLKRFIEVGAPPEHSFITGNLKYESLTETVDPDKISRIKKLFRVEEGDRILIGGSTHEGEEKILLDLYNDLRKEFPQLRLVLAPRHPERIEKVESVVKEAGSSYFLRSRLSGGEEGIRDSIIIVDTMGELSTLYSICTIAFVGGSFSGTGGHNMLEPAIFSKPVIVGPSTFNFSEDMKRLTEAEGVVQAATPEEFREKVALFLSEEDTGRRIGKNAREVVTQYRGAARRNMELFETYVIPGDSNE